MHATLICQTGIPLNAEGRKLKNSATLTLTGDGRK